MPDAPWRTSKLWFLPVSAQWQIRWTLFAYGLQGEVGILIPIFQMSNWNSEVKSLATVTQLVNDRILAANPAVTDSPSEVFHYGVLPVYEGDDQGGQAQALVESFSFNLQGLSELSLKFIWNLHYICHKTNNFCQLFLTSVPLVLVMALSIFKSDLEKSIRTDLKHVSAYVEWQVFTSGSSVSGIFTLDILEITCC